jgi:phage terminase small subunit
LTDKQKLFCLEYAACLNATRAAIKAGYSEDTAKEIGYENLTKPHLRAEVDLILSLRAMSAAEVIARIGQAARGQHADYWEYDAYGQPQINFRALYEDGMAHLIKEVEFSEMTGRVTKLKFADAQAALRDLGRHHKLFTDRVETEDVSDPNQNTERFRFLVDFLKSAGA